MSANPRSLQLLSSAPRGRSRAIVVAVVVALMGWASPAFAQSTTDDPSLLSPYGNTGETGAETTPAPSAPEPEEPTATTADPDRGGQLGDEADGGSSPKAAVAGTTASGNDPVVAGSTGRPARLAYTGAEPLLVGMLGAGMLLGAGVLHRRRRLVAD